MKQHIITFDQITLTKTEFTNIDNKYFFHGDAIKGTPWEKRKTLFN